MIHTKRRNDIQGLRGWAILLIVLWHMNPIFPTCLPPTGGRGAEFFFLISGFFVAYKFLDDDDLFTIKKSISYAVEKTKKLYPLYIITIIPMLILDLRIVIKNISGGGKLACKLISSILLVQSWIPDSEFYWSLNGVTWFLSSLVFCYAMSFITIRWLRKERNGFVALFLILMVEFVVEVCAVKFLSQDMCTWVTYICPAFRFLDYSLGMCVFKVYHDLEKNRFESSNPNHILFIAISLYILLSTVGQAHVGDYAVFHLFEVVLFLFIVCFPCWIRKLIFENKAMVWVGNMSMEIFLTHKIVLSYISILWEKIIGKEHPALEWLLIMILIVLTGVCTNVILNRFQKLRTYSHN